ncbi:MAG: DUF4932 domain-containing protein, partial [Elusimicrobia bacterium]|nr:DUF4932 domain-containing protein [Elusimicrobiota bacterium]
MARRAAFARALIPALLLAGAPPGARAAANPDRAADRAVGPDPNVGPNPGLGPNPSLGALSPAPAPDVSSVSARVEPAPPPSDAAASARPAPGPEVAYRFAVDQGIEVLAAAASLAGPAQERGRAAGLAALKDFPAVRRMKEMLARGVPEGTLSRFVMSMGPAPEFAPRGEFPSGLAGPLGGDEAGKEFLSELREFAKSPSWTKAWAGRAETNKAMVARGEAETRRTLSPEAVEGWFGTRLKDRYLFLLSDDLPSPYGANVAYDEDGRRVEVRLRSVMGWKDKNAYFSFDDFAGSVAHELTHTITDPIGLARSRELEAYSSLMVKGCTDSWTGCVLEHVNIAATLRALRAEKGDAAYRAMLLYYSGRGFPYLPALCARLAEYETPAARARGFAAFFPRVEDVFREALRAKFRAAAKANVVTAAAESAPARERFSQEFGTDPRLELVAVLHRLAAPADERAREAAGAKAYAARLDERFAAFAADPAAALTAKLDGV